MLRWSPARSTRGRARSGPATPSTTAAVRSRSETTPVPRERYQSVVGPVVAITRPPPRSGANRRRSSTEPSWRTSRAEKPRSPSQAGASAPRTTAAVLAALASTQVAPVTVTVRHGVIAELPVRGSMMWWRSPPRTRQRRAATPEVARPPPSTATTGPAESSGASWWSARRIGQPAGRRGSRDGDVAAERDEHSRAGDPRVPPQPRRPRPQPSRSRRDRARRRPGRRSRDAPVEPDAPPSRRAVRDGEEAPVAGANGDEGAVVAGEAKRAADGGVDEPAGAARDVDRERDGVEEAPGDADGLAGAAVQGRQLRVRPEAAGEQVDLAELDGRARGERRGSAAGSVTQRTAPVPSARSRAVAITSRRRRRRAATASRDGAGAGRA